MSMDKPITEQEGIMFAANPAWERRNKKKGFGSRKAAAPAPTVTPEPRTFAAERDYEEPMALETPVAGPTVAARPVLQEPVLREPVRREPVADEGLMAAPIGRPTARTTTKRAHKTSVAPAALAAGLVVLGAVGAVGWYATRGDDGIPELSPGQATTSEIAAAPLPPVEAPLETPVAQPAATPPAPAAEAAPARRVAQATPRTRPAATAAPSAGDSGMNASSTTLPDGPQPYSAVSPAAANPPVISIPAAPATQAAPAPTTEAPSAVPATPPTLPAEPAVEPPTTETPPTS